MAHGIPKLLAGPSMWARLGGALPTGGIDLPPALMGLLAALSECVGGLFLLLGFMTRPACFFLLITMTVAASMHIGKGDSFSKFSHALEAGILFLSMLLIGPGKYSIDRLISRD